MNRGVFLSILIFFKFVFWVQSNAQVNIVYDDEIYFEHIKSVKFHHNSLPTAYPIIDLNSRGTLKLSFDDMEGGNKDYVYSIVHCTKDWKKSLLNELEYMEGFNEADITRFSFSSQTIHDYTHYELIIPNRDIRWLVSGNYVLLIMDEDNDNELVLTRRFMVAESQIKIQADILPPFNAEFYNTHQRVDFSIDLDKFFINDPINELTVTILQNNRWDNAIKNIRPMNAVGNIITFNKFNTSSFPAGKEFRYFDIRDIFVNSDRIEAIEINSYSVDVLLKKEDKRAYKNYFFYREGNGTFVPNYEGTLRNGKTTSEYANIIFTMASNQEMFGKDIYVVGEFSAWKLYPENQMKYDEERRAYVAELELKQGYYNYLYAAVDAEDNVDFAETEGNWFETENDYTILVYYSQLGSRYDRLIGVATVNSLKDN